jgi:homeobox protein cut-like
MAESSGTGVSLTECNSVLEFWKEFDLESKRALLDQQCVEMRDSKSASINGSKKLNELTKSFRNKSKEEQLNGLTDVLKTYQEEIDQLSRRSKFSESAFSGLYKMLSEAPDPAITIELLIKSVGASSSHHFEVERLRNELVQYEEEFQQLKNQDITIRRLEDQLAEFKDQIEDKVAEEVDRRVLEVEHHAESRIRENRDAHNTAEKRLAAALESMKQAQSSTERAQNHLFDVSTQAENRISGLLAENSILAEGSERANSRVAELEAELDSARNMLTALQARTGGANSSGNMVASSSNVDLIAMASSGSEDAQTLHLMLNELRQEIRKKEDLFRNDKLRFEGNIRDLSQQLMREREQLSVANQELLERPTREDVQSLRRQLKLLQRVVFNANEDEDDVSLCLCSVGT